MDKEKVIKQSEEHPETWNIINETLNDTVSGYEHLLALKNSIPKELYAYLLREIWKMKTDGISIELALKMFENISPEDLMYTDELEAIREFDEEIEIYRGTDINEKVPRLCWTLRKSIATKNSDFANGRLFMAIIPKSKIIMYIAHDGDEDEIVAHVESGYKYIDER